ncbi:MAG: tyrosine-type recombinase/integrase [Actinomycetota bacterium]
MSHIQRRDKDHWRARYLDPGGRERSRTFPRKVDAERFLATVDADLIRGEWIDPRLGQMTFRQWAEEFEASRVNLQATTRAQHASYLRTRIMPWFGERRLASITEMQVRAFIAQLIEDGLAPATATKNLRILSQILKAAVRNRCIAYNPCDGVEGPGEAPEEETIFLTPQEVNAVADAVGERYGPMVLLAGYRGLRFGELAGLRPRRIQFLRGRLDVVEALKEADTGMYFGPPKYGRVRNVPLPPFLVQELAAYLAKFPPAEDLVFTSHDGQMLRRSNFQRRTWAPAVAAAGVDPRLTFHGLRHSAVSIMIDQGASLVELAAIMGWSRSTAAAMAMRYGHLFAAQEKRLTDAIEQTYRNARRPLDGLGASGDG